MKTIVPKFQSPDDGTGTIAKMEKARSVDIEDRIEASPPPPPVVIKENCGINKNYSSKIPIT
jgi:hypothetical protein